MNEQKINELIYRAGFSKTYERERLNKLIMLTIDECNSRQMSYTSHYDSIRYYMKFRNTLGFDYLVEFFP